MFPNLKPIAEMFYGMSPSFPFSEVTRDFIEDRFASVSGEIDPTRSDPNVELLNSLYTPNGNFHSVRNALVRSLHMVGLLGIKTGPTASVDWANQFRSALSAGELRPAAIIYIHPMFYRALGTRL